MKRKLKIIRGEVMGVIMKEILYEGSRGSANLLTLFDTGASMSFIRRSLAEMLDVILKLPRPMEFETADRTKKITAHEAVRLDFYLDGDRMSDEFLVLPDDVMSEEVIIGAGTMQKWRIVIDMENERVYSARKVKKHMLKFTLMNKQHTHTHTHLLRDGKGERRVIFPLCIIPKKQKGGAVPWLR